MNDTASSVVIRYLKSRGRGYINTKKRILGLEIYTSLRSRELIFLKERDEKRREEKVEGNI